MINEQSVDTALGTQLKKMHFYTSFGSTTIIVSISPTHFRTRLCFVFFLLCNVRKRVYEQRMEETTQHIRVLSWVKLRDTKIVAQPELV